jgi:hypothetical protein
MLVAYVPGMVSSLVGGFAAEVLFRPTTMIMHRLLLQGTGVTVRDGARGMFLQKCVHEIIVKHLHCPV